MTVPQARWAHRTALLEIGFGLADPTADLTQFLPAMLAEDGKRWDLDRPRSPIQKAPSVPGKGIDLSSVADSLRALGYIVTPPSPSDVPRSTPPDH